MACFDKTVNTVKVKFEEKNRVGRRFRKKKVPHVLVPSVRPGAMMERPSVNPSSSIAVHYIH